MLVANSGILGPIVDKLQPNPTLQQFKEYAWNWKAEDFNRVYEVNNTAAFFTAIAFLELLDAGNKQKNMPDIRSQVIITSSIASYLRVIVTGFAYVTSKAAATHLAKTLATYLAPYGIRSNAIAPGPFPSEMTGVSAFGTPDDPKPIPKHVIPAERAGDEKDMQGTILYLASRAGAYLNGNVVLLDGGRIATQPATY